MSRNQTKFIPKNHRPNPRPAFQRFFNYLPQDEAVATGLGAEVGGLDVLELQRVVDVLNKELSWLLRLKPGEFWKEGMELDWVDVESRFEESEDMGDRVNLTMGKSRDAETKVSSSLADTGSAKWGSRKKPQYYVKHGKNYSYKVDGSTAVASINEAKLMNQGQSKLIHGLGRGGNIPLGAVRKLAGSQVQEKQTVDFEIEGRGWDGGRGRGGRHGDSMVTRVIMTRPPKKKAEESAQGIREEGGEGEVVRVTITGRTGP